MMRLLLLVFFLPVLLVGCSGPAVPAPVDAVPVVSVPAGVVSPVVPAVSPTSTPWPTFTPVPTPTPSPSPTVGPTPIPTSTPWPRTFLGTPVAGVPVSNLPMLEVGPDGVPPAVIGENVFLAKQGLVAFRGGELPDYLRARDWDRMPDSVRIVSTDTRYMLWVIAYDFNQAPHGAELQGFIRWVSIRPGLDHLTMYERPIVLSHDAPFFYHGLGGDKPGLWSTGDYRVEFLDSGHNRVISAGFEVR